MIISIGAGKLPDKIQIIHQKKKKKKKLWASQDKKPPSFS